jgi:membrane-bound lytic murein transglycosylase D
MRATVQVQNGDTLWAIAQKFGVGVTDLCRWNGIRDPRRHKLQVGKELVVYPQGTAGVAASNRPG